MSSKGRKSDRRRCPVCGGRLEYFFSEEHGEWVIICQDCFFDTASKTNPFLDPSDLPCESSPFDMFDAEHYDAFWENIGEEFPDGEDEEEESSC